MNRLPEIEVKVYETGKRHTRIAFRVFGSTGPWTEAWMTEGDTLHLRFPPEFVWEAPVEVIELLYPTSEVTS